MNEFFRVYYADTQFVLTDIYPIQYGEEQCHNEHSFGPCVRSNYLLHYVYSGEGIFRNDNLEYKLHKGQMFLIKPNRLTYYKADHDNPWLYRWIEFNGSMAHEILESAGLSDTPVYNDDENTSAGLALLDIVQNGNIRFEDLMPKFWTFIASLTKIGEKKPLTSAQEYIKKAENYIKISLHKKITVNDVAEYVGINRSYLSRLFRAYKNISPQQYILALKMNTAAQYMKNNTSISITEAAQSVGYCDTHVFNKAFKSTFNSSPTEWRKKHIWNQAIVK